MKKFCSAFLAIITALTVYISIPVTAFADSYKNINVVENYDYANDVLKKVNKERLKAGVSALKMDGSLLQTAMLRASETSVQFSHTRPDGTICFSANEKMFGENIAMGQNSPSEVMKSWMNSDGHRENILYADYQSIGVGCVKYNGTLYWVQCFGFETADEKSINGSVNRSVKIALTPDVSTEYDTRKNIKTISLSKTSYVYDGKVKSPSVTVYDEDGNIISSKCYTVSCSSTAKAVGKYTLKVTAKGSYKGTLTSNFIIRPKSTVISKLKAEKKALTVKWKKQSSQTTGYQIQYASNSKFKKAKTITISKNKATSKRISKLTSKKKYYVRIRTYKNANGKKIYSSWSNKKSVKTK